MNFLLNFQGLSRQSSKMSMTIKKPWNDEFAMTIELLNAAGVPLNARADFLYVCVGDQHIQGLAYFT